MNPFKSLLRKFDALVDRKNLGAWWIVIFFVAVILLKVAYKLIERLG